MSTARIYGADKGDFDGGSLIWSAFKALQTAKEAPPTAVDLSELQLAQPRTVAAIAALGLLNDLRSTIVLPSTQMARDFVVRSGLLDFFDDPHAGSLSASPHTVPVRQLVLPSPTFADEITRAWEHEFASMPVGLRPRFADHLDEVIRNALSHAESPIGCVVAAQVFPTLAAVDVVVMDLGQTIQGHLTKNPAYRSIATDRDAILRATEEGVSGTAQGAINALGEPNSGVGLYELRRYCESGGGELTIASGEMALIFRPNTRPVEVPFVGGFPGCLVSVRFFVR